MSERYELESIIESGEFKEIALEELKPSPFNSFEMNDIDEMKSSIMSAGLLTPLSVIGPDKSGVYEILSGERRYTALRELDKEGQRAVRSVPCYVIGDTNMNETEKRLLIMVANITSRGDASVHSRRFEVVRLLKELEDLDPGRYGNVLVSAKKYLKVSDRYSRMYKQIFRCAGDDLKELAESGNIRINDASRLSSLPEETQKAAVKEVRAARSAQDKSDIVSRFTKKQDQEKTEDQKDKVQRFNVSQAELEDGSYDYLLNETAYDIDMDIDSAGYINRQKQVDGQSYEDSYQSKLTGIIEWADRMLKKNDPTDEEWDAIDACKRVADKFQ